MPEIAPLEMNLDELRMALAPLIPAHAVFDGWSDKALGMAAAELGVPVFMHPNGSANLVRDGAFGGRGDLGNIIGNPLETTYFLSRLIFDGTLDKHPGLRVIGVHGGGYLPSYLARTDVACKVRNNANCANTKDPRDYFKQQLIVDTMVLTDEGLRHLVAEVARLTGQSRLLKRSLTVTGADDETVTIG